MLLIKYNLGLFNIPQVFCKLIKIIGDFRGSRMETLLTVAFV